MMNQLINRNAELRAMKNGETQEIFGIRHKLKIAADKSLSSVAVLIVKPCMWEIYPRLTAHKF